MADYFSVHAEEYLRYGTALLIFLAFFLFSKLCQYKMAPILQKHFKKMKTDFFSNLLHAVNRPFATLWILVGAQAGLRQGLSAVQLPGWASLLFRIGYILLICWAGCNLTAVVPVLTGRHDRNAEAIKKLMRGGLKILIVLFAAVIILGELGYNVNGLITGLGLGGLTLSLAAQSSAANMFAGILLLTERPFELGDWIICGTSEGRVEDINLRSTKLRTFANTLIVVPNSTLCAASIDNCTRMNMRMKKFNIGICYNTPREKIETLLGDLRELLCHDAAVVPDTAQVRLSGFGESSIDILVCYYTKTIVYAEWLAVTERLNLEILDIMHKDEVEFAFPSRSLYLETPLERNTL